MIFFIFLFLLILFYFSLFVKDKSTIPNNIIQTYSNKSKIPEKVYKNIKQYGSNYKHIIFDDNDCIQFLNKYFSPIVKNKFNNLKKGAHKADLFRYCYLYIHGGVYIDIKTELIYPLDLIFNNSYIYTVISTNKRSIYQGIIATPPRKKIFLTLINHIINTPYSIINKNYSIFINYFYQYLVKYNKKKLDLGYNLINNEPYYLFQEKCSKKNNTSVTCYDGYDRYKLCCFIFDNNYPIIKVRYSDFPW